MTRRERIEARIEKRREWAEGRERKAAAAFGAAKRIADGIPLGQPILVGHHSEKHARRDQERIHSGMRRGFESADMAEHHESVAGNLEHALERSIYSDDHDAIASLEARIRELEATRARMVLVNRLYRKGDAAGLAELGLDLKKLRVSVAAIGLSFVRAPFEKFQLANLGGRIGADRKRIEAIRARETRAKAAEAAGGVQVARATPTSEYVVVTFAEKPERAVIDALKGAGFCWGGGSWSGRSERLPAEVAALASVAEEGGV
jgi:hypothetical protein